MSVGLYHCDDGAPDLQAIADDYARSIGMTPGEVSAARIDPANPIHAYLKACRIVAVKDQARLTRELTGLSQAEILALAKLAAEGLPIVFAACELVGRWDQADEDERARLMRSLAIVSACMMGKGDGT
jgi:hypothetical protein